MNVPVTVTVLDRFVLVDAPVFLSFFSFIFISLRSETILLLLRNSVAWSIIVFLLHDLVSECRVVRSDVFIGHQINVVGEQGAPLMHWLQLER
jgi:hypothetical protein